MADDRMKRREFSAEDVQTLRRLVSSGLTDIQIGERMTRNPKFIQAKRSEMSIAPGISRYARAAIARLNLRKAMARA